MGCGSSKQNINVPENVQTNIAGKKVVQDVKWDARTQKENIKPIQKTERNKPKEPDYDALSLASVATGKSLVFPDHNSVEALACTPSNKGRFVRMEDTFWSKKRKLIPDYSVMERIDAHVVKVRIITNKIMQKSYNHVIVNYATSLHAYTRTQTGF